MTKNIYLILNWLILETEKDEYQPGTFIETQTYQVTDYEKYNYWNNKSVGNLIKELRKLKSHQ